MAAKDARLVDVGGLPVFVMVTTAGVNDGPPGGTCLLFRLRLAHAEITLVLGGESAYGGLEG